MNPNNEQLLIIENIEKRYQCRRKQIRKLFHYLIGLKHDRSLMKNLVIQGPRSTGKTSIVKMIMDEFRLLHVWFDAVNFDDKKFFYEKVLTQLHSQLLNKWNDPNSSMIDDKELSSSIEQHKVQNHLFFLDKLIELFDEYKEVLSSEKLFFIIDNVDLLIEDPNNENLIYLLNNLNHLTNSKVPISVLWITKYPLERLYRLNPEFNPSMLEITFDPYTHDELYILLTESKEPFYKNFVSLILKTLIPFDNNLSNLKFICQKYFDDYCQPLEDEQVSVYKTGQLYVKFQPKLQEIIDQISGQVIGGFSQNIRKLIGTMSPSMCYLYISVYLATYNSTKTDIRFFVRNQKSKTRYSRKFLNSSTKDTGEKYPKWFELERAFHIYRALIDLNEKDKERLELLNKSQMFFRQFADLYDAKILLSKTIVPGCSSDSKYQLSEQVTDDIIVKIASRVDLNLNAFLTHPIDQRTMSQLQN